MNNPLQILLEFLLIFVGGVFLEIAAMNIHYLLTKTHYKEHHFTLGKYFFLLLFPTLASLLILYNQGWSLWKVFISFAILGTALEWFVDFAYDKIVGQRLWTYHRYSINRYTSLLSIPLWGIAGILAKLIISLFIS